MLDVSMLDVPMLNVPMLDVPILDEAIVVEYKLQRQNENEVQGKQCHYRRSSSIFAWCGDLYIVTS